MSLENRQQKILDLLKEHQRLTVLQLADFMAVSQETVRRDLNHLAADGVIDKFHGGASLRASRNAESAFNARLHENSRAKQKIARAAAALFSPGDSLFVDTGTTTLFFARALAEKRGLTIITNSLQIASALRLSDNRIFLIGGDYLPDAEETAGVLAIEQINRFNAEHAIITVGALGPEGAMDYLLEEAEIARAMVARARRLTVLADLSKFGQRALFPVFPLARIDRLVSDASADHEICREIQQGGGQLIEV